MLQATHKITIGTDRYSSPANSRLIRLEHSARMDTPVNVCNIVMAPPKGLSISPGDDLKVELGAGRTQALVFTGKVESVEWHLHGVRIEAASSMRRLVRARYNMYFEQSPAGTIVRNLCSKAGVNTGQVQPGLGLEYYAVGSNRNAAGHIRALARLCGFDTFADEQDKLAFALPVPGGLHMLQYGVNVLSISLEVPGEGVSKTELFGESPASFGQGPAAATWLSKKEIKASASGAGSGATMPVFDPAVRTVDNANLAARNYQAAFKPRKRGRVTVLGDPGIKLGHSAQIAQMPLSAQNGLFKITGVEHALSRENGFITHLIIEEP